MAGALLAVNHPLQAGISVGRTVRTNKVGPAEFIRGQNRAHKQSRACGVYPWAEPCAQTKSGVRSLSVGTVVPTNKLGPAEFIRGHGCTHKQTWAGGVYPCAKPYEQTNLGRRSLFVGTTVRTNKVEPVEGLTMATTSKKDADTLATLTAARDLLSDSARWTQGCVARDSKGKECSYGDDRAVCWCIIGALYKSRPQRQVHILEDAYEALEHAINHEDLEAFNDDDERTHDGVLSAFDRAIAWVQR